MEVAKKHVSESIEQPLLIIASEQTDGKGREDTVWMSPKGGFYGTYVFPLKDEDISLRGSVSLEMMRLIHYATALSIIQTLKQLYQIYAQVKWPNDIYLRGSKLGGIMIELLTLERNYLLIGIGVNLNTAQSYLSKLEGIKAISLTEELGHTVDYESFSQTLFDQLAPYLVKSIEKQSFAIITNYNDILYNKNMIHEYKSKIYTCKEVNLEGSLELRREKEIKLFSIEDSKEIRLVE